MKKRNPGSSIKLLFTLGCLILMAGCSNWRNGGNSTSNNTPLENGPVNTGVVLPEETKALIQKADNGCPCSMPKDETDPKYMLSEADKSALSEYKANLEEQNLNTSERRRAQAFLYQDLYQKARKEAGKPAEQYMVRVLEKMKENNEKIQTSGLEEMRKVLITNIEEVSSILKDFQNDLDPIFYEFTRAELKILMQLRKSVINEIAKR